MAHAGILATIRKGPGLSPAILLLLIWECLSGGNAVLHGAELHTAQQVREMTIAEAAAHKRVLVRGVVTFFDEVLFSRFIQDETAGIYLRESTNTPPLLPGQVVEVEGRTSPGEYAPIIEPQQVRIIGQANLPPPRRTTFEQLASGKEDSQFIEITGIVRSVHLEAASLYYEIQIATGGGRLSVYVKQLPVSRTEQLLDSTVRVRGVCSTRFNQQRQLFAIRLMVSRPEDLVVEIPAQKNPFATVTRPLGSLLQFAPQESYGHRIKVTGTVIYYDPGKLLFIQEGEQGLEVKTRLTTQLALGDRVEVLGFASQGEYTPLLEDSIFRKISRGPAPVPLPVSCDEALKGTHDCQLIRVTATLLDRAQYGAERYLILQSGKFIFHAYLTQTAGQDVIDDLQNGSQLSITGVCRIEPGEWQAGKDWRAKGFRLQMRSGADVVLLRAPPWWSLKKVLWVAGALAAIALTGLVWAVVLRRRVHKQTKIIREQLKTEAALKERYEDLFENANDMVFTHDLSGRITSINKTGESLLRRPRAQVLSQNLIEMIAEDQRPAARHWLDQIVRGVELPTAEWDFLTAEAQRIKLEISARLIAQNGNIVEVESIARDITERRRLERELLEISNREQRRIGHDLHDGVCQQLAAIAYRLEILGDRLQELKQVQEAAEAELIGKLINEANAQARNVARGLFPVRLQQHGLVLALEELIAGIASRFRVACRFVCETPPPKLNNEVELHLYFIAQEALLNAVNHGKATTILVTLAVAGDRVKLTVQDNGRGFDIADKNRTGMGIRIMRYRAKVVNAAMDLQSRPGTGTMLSCDFNPKAVEESAKTANERSRSICQPSGPAAAESRLPCG